jgi:hypothetical protein
MVPQDSALINASMENSPIQTKEDLYEFLEWQASSKGSPKEQAKFKEDARGDPGLLVFAVIQPKIPFVYLLHSVQTYPNAPGNDLAWKGKMIGFVGDRMSYAPAPQMVELKEKALWAWNSHTVCNDLTKMDSFYACPDNNAKL